MAHFSQNQKENIPRHLIYNGSVDILSTKMRLMKHSSPDYSWMEYRILQGFEIKDDLNNVT